MEVTVPIGGVANPVPARRVGWLSAARACSRPRVLTSSPRPVPRNEGLLVGSVIKKRRKRMAKKKHRKLLKKTRVQRRNKK
jgi:hypothetical protein